MIRLFDGRTDPTFRQFLAQRMRASREAAFAIRRIRLARLDFAADEWRSLERCRVLVGRIDADALDGGPNRLEPERIALLLDLAACGRLEVRSAGLTAWEPDFSVLRGATDRDGVAILGCHRFTAGEPTEGPTLACATDDDAVIRHAAARFDEIWHRGYDVLDAVVESLCRLPAGAE